MNLTALLCGCLTECVSREMSSSGQAEVRLGVTKLSKLIFAWR
jgi:hypothetical protein